MIGRGGSTIARGAGSAVAHAIPGLPEIAIIDAQVGYSRPAWLGASRRAPQGDGTQEGIIGSSPSRVGKGAERRAHADLAWSMIPKSGHRFSEKIMLKQEASVPIPKFARSRGDH